MTSKEYNHKLIESKWQKKWLESKVYSPDLDASSKPFYNLFMFPYPSAEGMHAGHAMSSTGSDIFGRFQRMNGFSVLQPMGYDSFGIHSENYAIKIGETPQEMLKHAVAHFGQQFKTFGHGYDWEHTVTTSDPKYYHWTQWLFKELFKTGLAYRKKSTVNFCPKDKTVLADEQVMTPKQAGRDPIDSKGNPVKDSEGLMVCERCGTIVEKRDLDVWFLRITDYAEKLLTNLDKINWSERVKIAQKTWIGKSKGMIINFKKENGNIIQVFTTRPDTLESATFIVQADEGLYNKHQKDKDKFGKFTNEYAINPLNNKKLPIWKASYVAPGYGTGYVMGVPAYDDRDKAFAKKYDLEILEKKLDDTLWTTLSTKSIGKIHTNYHLRDWGVGRQRYWGCPLPMIYCEHCAKNKDGYFKTNSNKLIHTDQEDWDWYGWWPEENIPVILPIIKDYKPEGNGRGPLANHPEFYEVSCPHCGEKAKRETDVADTFLDSSWYFLRYPSTDFDNVPYDKNRTQKWLPVNQYFGGAEHSVLHLMYARFVTMALKDLDLLTFDEPFPNFYAHGLMIKDGAKMSKSRGNVVNPDEYIEKFGADTLRMYVVFMGPMDGYPDFRDTGIEGMHRFIKRVWVLFNQKKDTTNKKEILNFMNKTIQKVTKDIEIFHYNTAISSIMEFVNYLYELKDDESKTKSKSNETWHEVLEVLSQLLAPFAPHLTEELWVDVLGNKFSVHNSTWPIFETKHIIKEQLTMIVQVNGKLRGQLLVNSSDGSNKEKIMELAIKDEKINKWINGKTDKVVFVPSKIINFIS